MKITNPWKCDGPGCNQVKGETNHWLLISANEDRYLVTAWNEFAANEHKPILHICSAECAGKVQSQWIAKINRK